MFFSWFRVNDIFSESLRCPQSTESPSNLCPHEMVTTRSSPPLQCTVTVFLSKKIYFYFFLTFSRYDYRSRSFLNFNQHIRWLRQAGGNLTSIKLLVRSLRQKQKLVFQVFDVVLAADEALFKHGNIQVSKWHIKVLWNSIVTWKVLWFGKVIWNSTETGKSDSLFFKQVEWTTDMPVPDDFGKGIIL